MGIKVHNNGALPLQLIVAVCQRHPTAQRTRPTFQYTPFGDIFGKRQTNNQHVSHPIPNVIQAFHVLLCMLIKTTSAQSYD